LSGEPDAELAEEFWPAIQSIHTLVRKFEETPYLFYNEYDGQRFLHHPLIRQEQFNRTYTTRNGKDTCLVHDEYPSPGNLRLDLVVLARYIVLGCRCVIIYILLGASQGLKYLALPLLFPNLYLTGSIALRVLFASPAPLMNTDTFAFCPMNFSFNVS